MSKKPVVLMVLDGYGISDKTEGNAIALANTPVMDQLKAEYPYVKGAASGASRVRGINFLSSFVKDRIAGVFICQLFGIIQNRKGPKLGGSIAP